jgi:glycosyltransferase involved in cell wall biosynthesis
LYSANNTRCSQHATRNYNQNAQIQSVFSIEQRIRFSKIMRFIQLTPGAGSMYCGNCLRDNALVAELARLRHDVCMVPLYLPLTLDENDTSQNVPVFYGGISVYLEHKIPVFRYLPRTVHRWLASRKLLHLVASRTSMKQPEQTGALTVSMLQGEHGHQATELDELCRWLKHEQQPDVVCFSNLLLLGMYRQIKSATGAKTVCLVSGEDGFLDALSEPFRKTAWQIVRQHAAEVDVLIAASRCYAGFMEDRLELPKGRIRTVYPGINLDGFGTAGTANTSEPVFGFFARLEHCKGLDTAVEAFVELRRRQCVPRLQFKAGGGCVSLHEPYLAELQKRIDTAGLKQDVHFYPNVSRQEKIALLQSFSVFSVPSRGNEAFGRFILESHAAGVPAVFPNRGAFPEILAETQGGLLFEPDNPSSLADAVQQLLTDETLRQRLATNARQCVQERFNITASAQRFLAVLGS